MKALGTAHAKNVGHVMTTAASSRAPRKPRFVLVLIGVLIGIASTTLFIVACNVGRPNRRSPLLSGTFLDAVQQVRSAHSDEWLPLDECRGIIDELIRVDSSSDGFPPASIISSIDGIPGHEKRPLDDDLRSLIRAPWSHRVVATGGAYAAQMPADVELGDLYFIVYTYRRHAGVVSRYRVKFAFSQDKRPGAKTRYQFHSAQRSDLARRVGAYTLPK